MRTDGQKDMTKRVDVLRNFANAFKMVKLSHYKAGQALRVNEAPRMFSQSAREGGKVVSPKHWSPLPPQEIQLVLISGRG
jgi:hypothetical protein